MKMKCSLLMVCIAMLALASQPVFASSILVQWDGSGGARFGSTTGVGYGSGSIWPNPSNPTYPNSSRPQVGVGLGGDSFGTADTSYLFSQTGHFNTWCVDITHWMSGDPRSYNVAGVTELAQAFGGTGTGRTGDLGRLANEFYSLVNSTETSAAFQQAVWAIMFGTKVAGQYNLDSDTFFAPAGNTGHGLALTWLGELDTAPVTGHYELSYLYDDPLAPSTQDMVVFTPAPVPEPGSLFLLGSGGLFLIGLGWNRRNKTNA